MIAQGVEEGIEKRVKRSEEEDAKIGGDPRRGTDASRTDC